MRGRRLNGSPELRRRRLTAHNERRLWCELFELADGIIRLRPELLDTGGKPLICRGRDMPGPAYILLSERGEGLLGLRIFENAYRLFQARRAPEGERERRRVEIELCCFDLELRREGGGEYPVRAERRLPGCIRRAPDARELAFLVEALDGLCRLLTAVFVKSSESWFDGINTAAFTFREGPGRSCRPMPLTFPYSARMPLSVKGGSRLWNSLRALGRPQPGHRAEFDFFWLRPGGGPEFCCVFILADRNRPERLVRLLRASEDFENGAAEAFLEYARAFGLPEALYYSRDEAGDLLNDLAFTCASSLRRVKRLPAVAAALRPLGPVL